MAEEKDDEISIDLSKIKGFFRKKHEEKKPEVSAETENKDIKIKQESNDAEAKQEEQKKDDDDINIDFGKIKNMFKKAKGAGKANEAKQELPETAETGGSEKDDDEISVDFSKIRGIFRKKESENEEPINAKAGKEKEEISIDFSKIRNIKNIFKKDSRADSESKEPDDNLSVDFKKIFDFFVKYRVLFLLAIPIFLSIYLRVQPAYLPATDEWAANAVISNLRSQISSQISQQYPNLPDQNKNALAENELQKVLQQQKSQIDQQIKATSDFFKSKIQDDSGLTYLITIDPYYWLRFSENIIKNGHPGDEIRGGKSWDNHMSAPFGRAMPYDMFHAYFTAYLFKFLSFFDRSVSLARVAFYIPVLISALAVIPAFFITRKIAGSFGGFAAAAIIAMHPSLLTRTMGGIFDTDGYNVTFPLLITWLFLEALEAKKTKNTIILSAAGGLLVGLFSFTWSGWWYIFDFILASAVLYIAYYSFVHRKELLSDFSNFRKQKAINNSAAFLLIFFIASALSTSIFVNFDQFRVFANGPVFFAKLKEVGITSIWPNVYTTVAEQNPASLNNVINQIGFGKIYFFLISLIGIALTLTRKEHKQLWFVAGALAWYLIIALIHEMPFIQDLNTFLIVVSIPIIIRIIIALWESDTGIDIKYAIFLILWFIAATYASTKGMRFTLLLVPAFAIGFGVAIGELYRHAGIWIAKGLHVNRYISKITVAVILLLLLVPPYTSARNTAGGMVSDFDDAWRDSLEKIKTGSKPDAIVNSWWDYGHWFKYWADRAVTFDGTSQNTPQAHWAGKVLLASDEKLAIGILRMLDCSGYSSGTYAFNELFKLTGDQIEAIKIMYEIMPKDKEGARKVLMGSFNENSTKRVMEFTHCQPPEDYFITSGDMIGKSGVWAHFGSWNFDRALIYNTLKKKEYRNDLDKSIEFLQERFNYSKEDAENLFYEVKSVMTSDQANNWIAPWPGYAGAVGCSRNEDVLKCDNGFLINLTSREAFAQAKEGVLHPKRISFPTNDGIIVKEYNESLVKLQNGRNLGFALIKEGDSYKLLQMDSDLTASMFTRLFYQEGVGLSYFKKFSDERSVFGSRIIVWKVDWEGKEKNVIETPKSETEEAAKTAESGKENASAVKNHPS